MSTNIQLLLRGAPRGAHAAAERGAGPRAILLRRLKRVGVRAGGVAACLAVLLAAIGLHAQGSWEDAGAQEGTFAPATAVEDQPQQEADEVAWNEMAISVASVLEVEEGQTAVEARIENPAANRLDQKVRIALADAPDEVLYESGALHPGEVLQTVELAHALPAGEYTAIVTFQGYEPQASLGGGGEIWGHDEFGASCAAEVPLVCAPKQA